MLTKTPTLTKELLSEIKRKAFDFGFDHLEATRPQISEQDKSEYKSWAAAGHAGNMNYMVRDPDKRVDVTSYYPGVQSVLTIGVSYYQGPFPEKPGSAYGRVARYAWGLDYHTVIHDRLQKFLKALDPLLENSGQAELAIDTKPILERALAKSAGLGFVGKNTVLIIPQKKLTPSSFHVGSWVFLTEVLLNIPLADEIVSEPLENGCGSCTKCIISCPTNAFEKPYRLKADRCISYLTIENKGIIPFEMREAMGDWIFGCDVCQDVCPYNARAYETRWPEFKADKGVGAWVSLKDLLSESDNSGYKKRWEATPLSRPKRRGMLRNACIVAGNSGDESLVPYLELRLLDPEPLIRSHALWALSKMTSSKKIKSHATQMKKVDNDSHVLAECERVLHYD